MHGGGVGTGVGAAVGTVGADVGTGVGAGVDAGVGAVVGAAVGADVGVPVGAAVGAGAADGAVVGEDVGAAVEAAHTGVSKEKYPLLAPPTVLLDTHSQSPMLSSSSSSIHWQQPGSDLRAHSLKQSSLLPSPNCSLVSPLSLH